MFGIGSLFSAGGPMVSQIINGMKDQQMGPIAGLAAQAGLTKKNPVAGGIPTPQSTTPPPMDVSGAGLAGGALTSPARQVPGIQGLTINTGSGPIGNSSNGALGGGINQTALSNAMAPKTVAASQPGQQAMANLTDMTERNERLGKVMDALKTGAETYQKAQPAQEEQGPPPPVMPSMGQNTYGGNGIGRLPGIKGGGIGRLARLGLGRDAIQM